MDNAREKRFWDRLAAKYAANPVSDMPAYEKTLERTRAHIGEGDRVLEFACGTGSTALKLAPHAGRYTATDISGRMIAIAREKAAGGPANLEFAAGTLDDAPWNDASFDAVIGFNALHLIDDVPAALARIHRLLKPGGLFISKTPCLADANPLIRLAVPPMRLIGKAPYVNFFSADTLTKNIETAGFEIIERGLHASKGKDTRPFLVARRKPN